MKRVVFPLDLLVLALLMQVGVHTLLQGSVLAVVLLAFGGGPQWSWLLLPLALGVAVAAASTCWRWSSPHSAPICVTCSTSYPWP